MEKTRQSSSRKTLRSPGWPRFGLRSPPLAAGETHTYRFRGVFRAGDELLIQDRAVAVEAGRAVHVTFDTEGAARVALPLEQKPAE